MRTEDVIASLAEAPPAARRAPGPADGMLVAAACGATLLLVWAFEGLRPHLAKDVADPRWLLKPAFALALALAGARACLRLAAPEGRPRWALWLAPAGLILAGGVAAELLARPASEWGAAALGQGPLACLGLAFGCGLLPVAALLGISRWGAPGSAGSAGAAAGLMGSGLGLLVYALHCPNDSPLFVALWYGSAALAVTLLGALLGRRVLAW